MTQPRNIRLDLLFGSDGSIRMAFYDSAHGNDVVCKVVRGKLVHGEETITLAEFIRRVREAEGKGNQ